MNAMALSQQLLLFVLLPRRGVLKLNVFLCATTRSADLTVVVVVWTFWVLLLATLCWKCDVDAGVTACTDCGVWTAVLMITFLRVVVGWRNEWAEVAMTGDAQLWAL